MGEWKDITLGAVLKYEQPYKYTVESTQYNNSGVPVLTAGKSFILGYTSETNNLYSNLPVIIFDDFTSDCKFVDFPFKVKSSAMKFLKERNEEEISLKYFYEILQTLKLDSVGGDHKRRWISEYSKIKIKAPDFIEQTHIAEILSTADETIAYTEALIAKYQRIKTGLMQDLLTRGIDENGNIRSKATHKFVVKKGIEVPEEWEVKELNNISSITRLAGYEYSTVWKAEENGEIIALRGFNVGNNKIIEKEFERISSQLSKQLNRSKLYIDDVVFPCVGTIGNAVVIRENEKYHINQNIAKITPKKSMSSDFITYYLMSEQCKKEIDRFNATSSQPNVLVGSLRKFIIPFPSEKIEQIKIVKIIEKINYCIDIETLQLHKLQSLKTGLMQDLLSGKVRVNMNNKN